MKYRDRNGFINYTDDHVTTQEEIDEAWRDFRGFFLVLPQVICAWALIFGVLGYLVYAISKI